MRRASAGDSETTPTVALPPWAYVSLAYSLFLSGSIAAISLGYLRPDMLLSSFFYLAAAILLNMSGCNASWKQYIILGTVMGIGFLAKAAMWPIATLVLMISLFVVADWRPALKMAVAAFALVFVIGSFYFVPLSRVVGKITLGQTGAYNYLVHVVALDRGRDGTWRTRGKVPERSYILR